MAEEEKKYFDSEAKRKWIKENTKMIAVKLNKNTDKDILEYFETQKQKDNSFSFAGAFKQALKEYIAKQK